VPKRRSDRIFLSQYIQNLYVCVLKEAQALAVFAAVAVLLACLGLSALPRPPRNDELGRSVFEESIGAGSMDILRMLLWQFSTPILWPICSLGR